PVNLRKDVKELNHGSVPVASWCQHSACLNIKTTYAVPRPDSEISSSPRSEISIISVRSRCVCGKRAGAFACLLDETRRYDSLEYANVEHKPDYKIRSILQQLMMRIAWPFGNGDYEMENAEMLTLEQRHRQAKEELHGKEGLQMPKFEMGDIESLTGKYDTVVCLDVLIDYPQNKADGMIAHLASLAENRVILSFAPKTFYYDLLENWRAFPRDLQRQQEHIFIQELI
ncbi:magnesium protoporphyrin IX methyltransferase, chloroplastic, partial [Tanacetum coccineum]